MNDQTTDYSGSCYCGVVQVSVSARNAPLVAGYCHCLSCRKWHAAPINAWTLWRAGDVTITGGEVTNSQQDKDSRRISCTICGGCVANGKPGSDTIVVYAMTLAESDFKFEPTLHIHYSERVMDIDDGLPKFADTPERFGGSGKLIEKTSATGWRP